MRVEAPARPVGAKLELTHACNLRCGFCYTDSPRHTLARTPELSDDDWLDVVDQAIRLGVIETVLTGGEPLLRRDLLLAIVDRFDAAGVGISLNTNGWFVDRELVERFARAPDFNVHVSIDGATPELHDSGRGVPGSWRRAVDAVHLFLEHGVRTHVAHVVTPENQHSFPEFLEQMWLLGVPSVRVTAVALTGAAARGGDWTVDREAMRRAASDFQRRRGRTMRVSLRPGSGMAIATRDDAAPRSLLVRPSGTVRIDSLHPFAFGHALGDGLEECWRRIVADWRDPEISDWAASIPNARELPNAAVVSYLDEEPRVGAARLEGTNGTRAPRRRGARRRGRPRRTDEDRERTRRQRLPRRVRQPNLEQRPDGDLPGARAHIRELALSRPYHLGAVRATGGPAEWYVRRADGDVCRLNATAATAMEALSGGTVADAVEQLAGRHPEIGREQLERDALDITRSLVARGVIVPAGAARVSLSARA